MLEGGKHDVCIQSSQVNHVQKDLLTVSEASNESFYRGPASNLKDLIHLVQYITNMYLVIISSFDLISMCPICFL